MNVIYQTDRNYPALTANTGCRAKRTKDGPREILRSSLVNAYLKMGYESEGLNVSFLMKTYYSPII